MSIINEIKEEVKNRDITVSEICQRTGLLQPNVWRFFNGKTSPTLKTVEKICSIMDLQLTIKK